MKAILLTNSQPNQAALYYKLREACTIEKVVVSKNIPPPGKYRPQLYLHRISARLVGGPFVDAWQYIQARYKDLLGPLPEDLCMNVDNINDGPVVRLIREVRPDVVLVSGTNQPSPRLIETGLRYGGLLNLHTGLSPYVDGGPNCTNWCLATGRFHLIGNALSWLDASNDGGPLVATEQTKLTGHEDLRTLHWKVMQHGHDLFRRVVAGLAGGRDLPYIRRSTLPQGRRFDTRQWNAAAMMKALRRFRRRYGPAYFRSPAYVRATAELRTFPWPEYSIEDELRAALYRPPPETTDRPASKTATIVHPPLWG